MVVVGFMLVISPWANVICNTTLASHWLPMDLTSKGVGFPRFFCTDHCLQILKLSGLVSSGCSNCSSNVTSSASSHATSVAMFICSCHSNALQLFQTSSSVWFADFRTRQQLHWLRGNATQTLSLHYLHQTLQQSPVCQYIKHHFSQYNLAWLCS